MDYEVDRQLFKKCEKCNLWGNPSKENSKFCRICVKIRTKCNECHEWDIPSKEISQICQLCIWKYGKCNDCNEWRKPSEESSKFCRICIKKRLKCGECIEMGLPSKEISQICQLCIWKYGKCNDCNEWRKPSKENNQFCQKCIIKYEKCKGCEEWTLEPCRQCNYDNYEKCDECHNLEILFEVYLKICQQCINIMNVGCKGREIYEKSDQYDECIKNNLEDCIDQINCTISFTLCDECHVWGIPSIENIHICQQCIEIFKKSDECREWRNPSEENEQIYQQCIKLYKKCDKCHEQGNLFKVILRVCKNCILKYLECEGCNGEEWIPCRQCIGIYKKCDKCNEWIKNNSEDCQNCWDYCDECYVKKPFEEHQEICQYCSILFTQCNICHLWESPSIENINVCQQCICKFKKCDECNEWRRPSEENPHICQNCVVIKYKECDLCHKKRKSSENNSLICQICYENYNSSENQDIDEFIKYTQINCNQTVRMEFFPYYQFKDVKFIAEGGFSKIYQANWIDGKINVGRKGSLKVALKNLNNSKNISYKELNELKIYYILNLNCGLYSSFHINEYYGITRDPITGSIMFIMKYYESGDLGHYIIKNYYKIGWIKKLEILDNIVGGLDHIHNQNFIHRDLHSGNILYSNPTSKHPAVISDLGISKSSIESTDNDKIYGIIPYISPEIFLGQKYTTAMDIYSFGMIMWELMTGRKPFWDEDHDTELIIGIIDGFRPPIVTNAPEGFIELMQKCWDSDPNKRPTASDLKIKLNVMKHNEYENVTECNKQTNMIGPITTNNQKAIYKSRSLSEMIKSAMLIRNSRSQIINSELGKRKLEDDNKIIKRSKLFEDINNDYVSKEMELETNKEYITKAHVYDI